MLTEDIAHLPEVSFSPGEEIITEGVRPDRLLFLRSGKVEVTSEGVRISVIKTPGSVFGELSLLLDTPATATVTAMADCVFHVVEDPMEFLEAHPRVTLQVGRTLAWRLDAATKYLVDAKEQLRECSDHVGMVDGVLDAILHKDLRGKVSGK